jgi:hypothetical protein
LTVIDTHAGAAVASTDLDGGDYTETSGEQRRHLQAD